MKRLLPIFFFALLLVGCKDDLSTTGSEVLPAEDAVIVNVDTFSVASEITRAAGIYSSPDSLLLGEIHNQYGTLHADILTQVACPLDFEYPEGAEVDSVCIYLYYNTYFGVGNSPMQISVYEMDKSSFNYTDGYRTTLDLDEYWSGDNSTMVASPRIFTAATPTDSIYNSSTGSYVPYLRFLATDAFAEHFFSIRDFTSQQDFSQKFKGLYISSDFGGATVLNLSEIGVAVYYTFTYDRAGQDTTVQDVKLFYANAEVRQVNRLDYHISDAEYSVLESRHDDTAYVVSPAHIYTRLSLPMRDICDKVEANIGDKRVYVNRALLRADVLNVYRGQTSARTPNDWQQPATYMMLCIEDSLTSLLDNHAAPTSTYALISTLYTSYDSDGEPYDYYSYDLASLLTQQIRNEEMKIGVPDTLKMVLVPVTVETATATTGASYYTSVRPDQTITATAIRSAQSTLLPLELEVTASGF